MNRRALLTGLAAALGCTTAGVPIVRAEPRLVSGAITADNIACGNVVAEKIDAKAVTAENITPLAITERELAPTPQPFKLPRPS